MSLLRERSASLSLVVAGRLHRKVQPVFCCLTTLFSPGIPLLEAVLDFDRIFSAAVDQFLRCRNQRLDPELFALAFVALVHSFLDDEEEKSAFREVLGDLVKSLEEGVKCDA